MSRAAGRHHDCGVDNASSQFVVTATAERERMSIGCA